MNKRIKTIRYEGKYQEHVLSHPYDPHTFSFRKRYVFDYPEDFKYIGEFTAKENHLGIIIATTPPPLKELDVAKEKDALQSPDVRSNLELMVDPLLIPLWKGLLVRCMMTLNCVGMRPVISKNVEDKLFILCMAKVVTTTQLKILKEDTFVESITMHAIGECIEIKIYAKIKA